MDAKSLAELGKIKKNLAELDFQMQIFEKSAEIPVNMLICAIPKDYKNREQSINLAFLPVMEDDFKAISLLQIYSVLPFAIPKENINNLKDLFIYLNHRTTIGNFTINENNEIAFRYILAINKFKIIEKDVIQEIVILFNYMIDLFNRHIEAIADGSKSLKQVFNEIDNF